MSGDQEGVIRDVSDAGVAGEHGSFIPVELLVGSATQGEFNTAHLQLVPIACWRVDDIRFAFDSSFVTAGLSDPSTDIHNDIRAELGHLADLVKAHPDSPLSVFGHADPVGSDSYNKALSGRRATAIYALLISNTEPSSAIKLWQKLSATEHWGADHRQTMQDLTGLPEGTDESSLFRAYMQKLCPANLQLKKKDFLGQGADTEGKGDYQGCGEFNPVLIFSREKQARFEQAKANDDKNGIAERNLANAPNRRVLVLLFRKGSRIDPGKWPCPRATEGTAGCILRLFSDGEKRRSTHLQGIDRKYSETKDTFACRFYDRLLRNSPCDPIIRGIATFQITRETDGTPVKNALFEVRSPNGSSRRVRSDEQGFIRLSGAEGQSFTLVQLIDPKELGSLSNDSKPVPPHA